MTRAPSATALAFAKVNPILRVLGRQADGYHRLETLLVALDLSDRVRVTRRERDGGQRVTVETTGPMATSDIVDDGRHLAARGAALALDVLGSDACLHVHVSKEIPSRAGLGGGSADAAAAAFASIRLLADPGAVAGFEGTCASRLAEIGMDCAFFGLARDSGAGFGTGRGEEVRPLAGRLDWEVLVLTPDVECSTPGVYGALGLAPGESLTEQFIGPFMDGGGEASAARLLDMGADEARHELVNGLERAAVEAEPRLGRWFDLLDDLGLQHMRLAGSGSSLFGLFDPRTGAAQRAAEDIAKEAAAQSLNPRLLRVLKPARAGVLFHP